jgi:hypothetical protein
MALIGTNMTVSIQQTLETALTVSAITQASPGVATSAGHTLANGDIMVLDVPTGMVELDGKAVRIANVATDTFELEGVDTTLFSTFTAGTAAEVSAFATLAMAQSVAMPQAAPAKIDITRLIDKVKRTAYGLTEAADGTIVGLYDPADAGVVLILAASAINGDLVIMVDWAGGDVTVANSTVSGGDGFDLQQNDAAKQTINFTPVNGALYYPA